MPRSQNPAGLNGGYLTNIRVRGIYQNRTSACRSGRSLALAYYKCRRGKSVRGSCSGRTINGLRCRESNRTVSERAGQLNATVTCTKGSKRITHRYQQNLFQQ
ncbi:MAG: hypothetical protein Q8O56_11200 [Solirubrobacteraceae bacterium]|nr:hypothetical protein [Solirubrobacteraceae bacterium]